MQKGTGKAVSQPSAPDPFEIDYKTPSVARMYDFYLGGKNNYLADREACALLDDQVPGTRGLAINNRRYLERVVRILAEEYGVRQFIDNGTGLPTQNNVHTVAQGIDPRARVMYIDKDPVVLTHGRALLQQNDNTVFAQADMRDLDGIFDSPDRARLIDLNEPVAALYISVLHCIPDDDDPWGLVRRFMERLPSGSFLAVSHLVAEDDQLRERLTEIMLTNTAGNWGRVRRQEDVIPFFDGLEILDPGLVEITTWRPDGAAEEQTHGWIEFGGIGRKS